MAKWLLMLLIFCAASVWCQTARFESAGLKRLDPTSETDKQIETLQDHVKDAPGDYAGYDGLGSAFFQKAPVRLFTGIIPSRCPLRRSFAYIGTQCRAHKSSSMPCAPTRSSPIRLP